MDFALGVFFGGVCVSIIVGLCMRDTPEAIDVYRGNTTLEITYRDSVAVDSVVVYKMK